METLILVNRRDKQIGTMEKLLAHRKGLLHRCISVFVFDDHDRWLLQQRAKDKYHSGGLWSNACCGHQRPGEKSKAAAERRLMEEMGIKCELKKVGSFIYRARLDRGLTEHEFDHVFFGKFKGAPKPDPQEVSAWKWLTAGELEHRLQKNPQEFTYWLKFSLKKIESFYASFALKN